MIRSINFLVFTEHISYFAIDESHVLVDTLSYRLVDDPQQTLQVMKNAYNSLDYYGILREFSERTAYYRRMTLAIFISMILFGSFIHRLDKKLGNSENQ